MIIFPIMHVLVRLHDCHKLLIKNYQISLTTCLFVIISYINIHKSVRPSVKSNLALNIICDIIYAYESKSSEFRFLFRSHKVRRYILLQSKYMLAPLVKI